MDRTAAYPSPHAIANWPRPSVGDPANPFGYSPRPQRAVMGIIEKTQAKPLRANGTLDRDAEGRYLIKSK